MPRKKATLGHPSIDCAHLLLGLLRIEACAATAILRGVGVTYQDYLQSMISREPAAWWRRSRNSKIMAERV